MEEKKYSQKKGFIKNIAFFGDANITETDETYTDVFKLAESLAKEDYVIVDGGGPGVMEAATNGAKKGGGKTITVTFDPTNAPGFEGKYVGNIPDTEIVTTNYIERMFKLMELGDIFIMFKGGTGTISEFGTAWVLAKLYFGCHKPFILFGEFWIEIIDAMKKNLNIDSKEMSVFEIARKTEDVLPIIAKFEKSISQRPYCAI
ncbi:MAG: LOG family protein [Candidatus Woesebacteria bacterium]|nr:LOG family protein [Candidatus Woesebacteria bacterium]